MIDKLFIISIGGSGARAARAFTHLCAMGFGPAKVKFFFVDIDINNGDFLLTRDTIQCYIKIRKQLGDDTVLFKTEIELLTSTAWSPLTGLNLDHNTLRSYLTYLPTPTEYKKSEKLLFSEDELDVSLDQGCRAHPNIGSFLISSIFQDERFRNKLKATLEENNSGIYLYHSIFGGTGAAGGPVIIKGINERFRKDSKNDDNDDNLLARRPIGDSVLFPYFIVPEPNGSEEELLKIKSETFDFNAAGALPFYKDSVPADHIYFLGDQEKTVLKEYIAGNKEQKNPAHMLEFYAGLMTVHFCQTVFIDKVFGNTKFWNPVFGNDKVMDDYSISFEDIPQICVIKEISEKQRIIDFQLTSTFYRYFFKQSRDQKLTDYVWLDGLLEKKSSVKDKIFDHLQDYFKLYNTWIEQMNGNHPALKLFENTDDVRQLFRKQEYPLRSEDELFKYLNIASSNKKVNIEGIINKIYNGIHNFTTSYKITGGNNA